MLLSHLGSDALPAYSLRHPDPALPASKNRYAAALYDSYNPEILFGEVLLIPEWTQPTLDKEEIRRNGGAPPPPEPILPTEFVIQLYNPDQQVAIKWHGGSWASSGYWGFEMPQQSFRQPSTSTLDRTKSDPTASEITPKLGFKWKKEGKLSKELVCSLSGKSTNPDGSKRKNKEPDITVAIFKHFKEITIYQPNLSRVEMEDLKGLEVVLILGAIVIREVYNSNMRDTFNITDSPPTVSIKPTANSNNQSVQDKRQPTSQNPPPPPRLSSSEPRPPPTDPRSQWELDVETARLKKQVEHEERQRRRADAAETKRVQKMLEEEDRRRQEKQRKVDRETERLKRVYGQQQYPSPRPSKGQAVTAYPPAPVPRPHSTSSTPYIAHNLRPPHGQGPYLQPSRPGAASSSGFFGGVAPPRHQRPTVPKKSSFWHIGKKEDPSSRLSKQRSTVF